MKLTYNWLKDFVGIRLKPQELAGKLTMAGIEVSSIEEKDGDFVFEIEITSNRPDWLSVIGIAREVAAITGSKLSTHSALCPAQYQKPRKNGLCKIKIEDKKDCPLYTAKIIKDVKVSPSPEWLRKRLELIGCRSVNNIVDVTNYALFTYGEPLHAFDMDKIVESFSRCRVEPQGIIIRRAVNGEEIVTIDGIKRKLDKDILIIAACNADSTIQRLPAGKAGFNDSTPIAIAGIMGGKDVEVCVKTKNILLEAAVFNPVLIRRGRQKLGMQTDSSYRFERGMDFETPLLASSQAVCLIEKLAYGKYAGTVESAAAKPKTRTVIFDITSVAKVLGKDVPIKNIKKGLSGLGFKIKQKSRSIFSVAVPPYRQDVESQADLVEEVARIYGYENIPVTLPYIKPRPVIYDTRDIISIIKNILVGLGLSEVITHSLIAKDSLQGFAFASIEPAQIKNPLSREQEILRPSIIPSLAANVAFNLNQKQSHVSIFEAAKIFPGIKDGLPREEWSLAIALCGEKGELLENGCVRQVLGMLHLKGMIETMFSRLGIKACEFKPENDEDVLILCCGQKSGIITKLNREILNELGIKNKDVFVAEIYLEAVLPLINLRKSFSPLPLYPGISRDISLLLNENIKASEIFATIRENAGSLLENMEVVDVYKGKQIPRGYRSLTISCFYRSNERTLTEDEITPLQLRITDILKEKFGAQIR